MIKYLLALICSTSLSGITDKQSVTQEIIESVPFQRLKEVRVCGICYYTHSASETSYYDLSIARWEEVKKKGGSEKEELAALLGDIAQVAFSNVGDFIFGTSQEGRSYQEIVRLWFLEESGISTILARYDLNPHEIPFERQTDSFFCPDLWENNLYLAQAIKRALDLEVLNMNDLHWGTDESVWTQLIGSKDFEIEEIIVSHFTGKSQYTLKSP